MDANLIGNLLLSLTPAILMIVLVLLTRKVILSLGSGIVVGALIYNIKEAVLNDNFNLFYIIKDSSSQIFNSLIDIITSLDWYIPIILFVVLIGSITAVITVAGGTKALAEHARSKIKNEKQAQIMTWIYGLIIAIDDYFNTLVIGEISKPITDEHNVSRAKLAYIIDSTSAPVVILLPVSTWAAYVIGEIGKSLTDNGFTTTGFSAFVKTIPLQFYPVTALLMVLLVALYKIDIGPMKKYEESAAKGEDISKQANVSDIAEFETKATEHKLRSILVPMIVLIAGTLITMLVFTLTNEGSYFDQNIALSLFVASIFSLISAIIIARKTPGVAKEDVEHAAVYGSWGMLKTAVLILIFAWCMGAILESLETGRYLGEFLEEVSFPTYLIPALIFVIAGLMAFSTGTSWGTFAVVIPIGGAIAGGMDVSVVGNGFVFSIMAAAIGGAVLGDHCSPISDTTVLSATGAGSTLDSHFSSQLPYAIIAGVIAIVAYIVFGITKILLLSYLSIGILLVAFVFLGIYIRKKSE